MAIELRALEPDDWPAVRAIYLEGIATGMATFQTETPTWEVWNAGHVRRCRIVATERVSSRRTRLAWRSISDAASA